MKIKTYKFERVEVDSFELPLPEETLYCFETGIRRSIKIVPRFTTWQAEQGKQEELYQLIVTCIYQSSECKIDKFSIPVSRIEEYYNSKTESKEKSILTMLANEWHDLRTKEDFETDLKMVLTEITE